MGNEEILAALKVAMSKGDSLNKAMLSLYNAGYPKSDIEEAARLIQAPQVPSQTFPINAMSSKLYSPSYQQTDSDSKETEDNPSLKSPISRGFMAETKTEEKSSTTPQTQQQTPTQMTTTMFQQQPVQKFPLIQQTNQTQQKVSNYDDKLKKSVSGRVVFLLSFFLLFLIGILVAVVVFRDNLAAFFNGLL